MHADAPATTTLEQGPSAESWPTTTDGGVSARSLEPLTTHSQGASPVSHSPLSLTTFELGKGVGESPPLPAIVCSGAILQAKPQGVLHMMGIPTGAMLRRARRGIIKANGKEASADQIAEVEGKPVTKAALMFAALKMAREKDDSDKNEEGQGTPVAQPLAARERRSSLLGAAEDKPYAPL